MLLRELLRELPFPYEPMLLCAFKGTAKGTFKGM
jgi:hypothetical protein